jgi:Derlin-2/3
MCTVATQFGFINPRVLLWSWPAVKRFQIWRIITTFTFFGRFSFPFLMQMMMLVQYSSL